MPSSSGIEDPREQQRAQQRVITGRENIKKAQAKAKQKAKAKKQEDRQPNLPGM